MWRNCGVLFARRLDVCWPWSRDFSYHHHAHHVEFGSILPVTLSLPVSKNTQTLSISPQADCSTILQSKHVRKVAHAVQFEKVTIFFNYIFPRNNKSPDLFHQDRNFLSIEYSFICSKCKSVKREESDI